MKWNPRHDLQDWISNWRVWYAALQEIRRTANKFNWGRGLRLFTYFYWLLDVGVNCLTGGDPEETISSRVYKDKNAVLGRMILQYVEFASDDEMHGEKAFNPNYGEDGQVGNRELSVWGQILLIAATAASLLILLGIKQILLIFFIGTVVTRLLVFLWRRVEQKRK